MFLEVIFGAKNHPNYTLNNIDEIAKIVKDDKELQEIKDAAILAIANEQSKIFQEEKDFAEQDIKGKAAIFTEIILRIKEKKDIPDLDALNDLVKGDQINSAQYDAILRFLNSNEQTNENAMKLIDGLYYVAETVGELDDNTKTREISTQSRSFELSVDFSTGKIQS